MLKLCEGKNGLEDLFKVFMKISKAFEDASDGKSLHNFDPVSCMYAA